MGKRVGPEAKIITLFTALPDDSKRIVLEIIKSQTVRAPKSTTVPSAGKRSPRGKSGDESKASTEGATGSVTTALTGKCAVPNCGLGEDDPLHHIDFSNHPDYHKFRAAIKTKGVVLPDNPEGFLSKGSAA